MTAILNELPYFDTTAIPTELKALDRWAPWKLVFNEKRGPEGKYDKIPLFGLSTAKPEWWYSFDTAMDYHHENLDISKGLGFCITGASDVVMVDLDSCVGEDGQLSEFAYGIVTQLDSYTELSPSGQGLRIVVKGSAPFDWTNHDKGIEVYAGHENRFLTITGNHLEGTPLSMNRVEDSVLAELADTYGKARKNAEVIDLSIPDLVDELTLPVIDDLGLPADVYRFLEAGETGKDRSSTLHATGMALYAVGLSDSQVLSVLANNSYAMEIALDHRRQDPDRALMYLWREHCLKAKAKGLNIVAQLDEFEVLDSKGEESKPLPGFERDKHGQPLASLPNIVAALERSDITSWDLKFDEFKDERVVDKRLDGHWQPFTDPDYVRLRLFFETRLSFKPISADKMRDAVLLVSSNNTIDTAITWLKSLEWDGVPRVESFLADYFSAGDCEYTRAVSKYMWTAMAGRVLKPGCKADMVPILVGEQGTGKSTAVSELVPSPDFFSEVSFQESDDDLARKMRGCLVAEIGELRGLRTRDLEGIKAFITRTHENWVPKYQEYATQFPRRVVFIGTTNEKEFLADETGNRRWLPVQVGKIDTQGIKEDRLQLWAEAAVLFTSQGVEFKRAEELAEEVHEQYRIHDSWEETVNLWLNEPDLLTGDKPSNREFLRVREVLIEALGFNERNITRREEMRMGAILSALGLVRKRVQVEGKRMWVFTF